jgi:RimJ/RimL family protein N-acetyltransferase
MRRISPGNFSRVLPLLQQSDIRSHLALAHTVLEGRQEGQIFVDDEVRPRTALICPRNGFYFLLGDPGTGCFERFVPELLAGHLVDKCAVYATSIAWTERLDSVFSQRVSRTGFEFSALPVLPPSASGRMPPGLVLERMTPRVVAQWGSGLDPWVIEIWGGPERLCAEASGFCIRAEGGMVSFATACAIGGGEAEVEVGTAPEYRGRGLAGRACRAFMEECLTRGLRPAWSCSAGHQASTALARKLGFVESEAIWGYPLEPTLRFHGGVWGPA